MDYADFTSRQDAFNGFVKYRREVLDSEEKGGFVDAFTELCTKALAGDCVAQDCVAYFFNHGVPNYLDPNYDYYMSWQILAGANGNEFALEKLEFFLNPALNAIVDDDELLATALKHGNITRTNALMVISNLLCEGIVDELKLSPKNLINIKSGAKTFSPQLNRVYVNALNNCLNDVVAYLKS